MRRYSDLDGMRGILALIIVFYHYGLNTVLSLATHGRLSGALWGMAVDMFFVLSGFVLARSIASQPVGLGRFAFGRFMRLAPVYFVTMAMMAFIEDRHHLSATGAWLNLTFTAPFIDQSPLNPPAWSVCYELYLPLLLVPAMPLILKLRRRPALLIAVAAGAVGGAIAPFFFLNPLEPLVAIGAGAILYRLHSIYKPEYQAAACLALFGGLLFLMALSGNSELAAFLTFPLALVVVFVGAGARSVLSAQPFQWLGALSYTIYMVHWPVMIFSERVLQVESTPLVKAGWVVGSVALAVVLRRYVELPMIALGKRLASRPSVAVA